MFEIAIGIALGLGLARCSRIVARHAWNAVAGRILPRLQVDVPGWWWFLDDLLGPMDH